jgi:hypothetical protein
MPCIQRSGALPSVPRRRWPTLTASCSQVQFSDLRAQARSVAASLRYRLRTAGKDIIMDGSARGKRRSRSRRFRGRIRLARGLQHLEERRLQRQGRADLLDAPHSPASPVHDLDRGRSRGGHHPPHEHAHPARLPTPTQDVSDHIETLPPQYDTFAAIRFPRIESGIPILQRSGPSFIEARRSSGHESGILSASAYSRSAVNSHLMVPVGAAIATSVDPG